MSQAATSSQGTFTYRSLEEQRRLPLPERIKYLQAYKRHIDSGGIPAPDPSEVLQSATEPAGTITGSELYYEIEGHDVHRERAIQQETDRLETNSHRLTSEISQRCASNNQQLVMDPSGRMVGTHQLNAAEPVTEYEGVAGPSSQQRAQQGQRTRAPQCQREGVQSESTHEQALNERVNKGRRGVHTNEQSAHRRHGPLPIQDLTVPSPNAAEGSSKQAP